MEAGWLIHEAAQRTRPCHVSPLVATFNQGNKVNVLQYLPAACLQGCQDDSDQATDFLDQAVARITLIPPDYALPAN